MRDPYYTTDLYPIACRESHLSFKNAHVSHLYKIRGIHACVSGVASPKIWGGQNV